MNQEPEEQAPTTANYHLDALQKAELRALRLERDLCNLREDNARKQMEIVSLRAQLEQHNAREQLERCIRESRALDDRACEHMRQLEKVFNLKIAGLSEDGEWAINMEEGKLVPVPKGDYRKK